MICTTLQNKDLDQLWDILESGTVEMAEIRLDRCPLSIEEIRTLFSGSDVPLIATCRFSESGDASVGRLLAAIESGARYADLELEAPPAISKRIRTACDENGVLLIRSYHNYLGTFPRSVLQATVDKCRRFGADIVKIVTTAATEMDMVRVLSLYDTNASSTLIAFAMGEVGKASRVECLRRGAPFSYAAYAADETAAPGQRTTEQMYEAVYGRFRPIRGAEPIPMPASKSIAQRAILAAALAEGTSHLRGYTPCGDTRAAIAAARALGAKVTVRGSAVTITGIAATAGSLQLDSLKVGESGFLARLMIPLLSVLNDRPVQVTGEKTLLQRPLLGAHDLMASFGVTLRCDRVRDDSQRLECFVPVTVHGPLIPGRADLDGSESSQLISGLLTALPFCEEKSEVCVQEPRSIPYLFITMDILRRFGVEMTSEMEGDEDFMETHDWRLCTAITFHIKGGQHLRAADIDLEGDWSGAANFLVAGAIFGSVDVTGVGMDSLQADLTVMDILMDAGANLSEVEDDHLIHVQKAVLNAFEADLNNCPDLFPVTAVLAAFCPGRSRLAGVSRLATKECDRSKAILEMLNQLGVRARVADDALFVDGIGLTERIMNGKLLHGGIFTSHHDHRMVMALKVASLGADNPIVIDDEECVAKSFPQFLEYFETLRTDE